MKWVVLLSMLCSAGYVSAYSHIMVFRSAPDMDGLRSRWRDHDVLHLPFDSKTHIVMTHARSVSHFLKRQPGWMATEPNHRVTVADANPKMLASMQGPYVVQLNVPSWGLSRISQKQLPLNNRYGYPDHGGEGTNIYVIDSGVNTTNPDFEGRATWGLNLVKDSPNEDELGHGTLIAGIAAGRNFGVAKKASIVGIKVLSKSGQGDVSDIIQGLYWVLQEMQQNSTSKVVVNLSLSAENNSALNEAVDALTRAGAVIIAAAGNSHPDDSAQVKDACQYSPASSSTAVTVGSTDEQDALASFSNRGSCVKLLAPGDDILSDQQNYSLRSSMSMVYSGTSYSAPHVAGVAALLFHQSGINNTQVTSQLYALASPGLVQNLTNDGTPNLLLYVGFDASQISGPIQEWSSAATKTSAAPSSMLFILPSIVLFLHLITHYSFTTL
ncbi:peptidase S8/S53 domain-containing protein [Gongronella butleri]|nr:peptidase S8/S53 domain-containing protein [Gongronella butleri]